MSKQFRPRWSDKTKPLIKKIKSLTDAQQLIVLNLAIECAMSSKDIKFTSSENEAQLESVVSTRIKTIDDLIEQCEIDLNHWEIDRYVVNKWEVGTAVDGEILTEPLFQVKAWLKRSTLRNIIMEVRTEILNEIEKHSPYFPVRSYTKSTKPHLLEISIFDLHFGKLCWGGETGEDYDTKIASKRFLAAIESLLEKSKGFDIERIIFPIGNDFFNSDSLNNTTTAGTPQDEDLRWQKTFRRGRQLLIQGIDMLSQIAPVDVLVVQGNHDFERAFYVGDVLEAWYHNNENVVVDNNANPRKYKKYGECLIGFTHGNNEKIANLPLIAAHEKPKEWATTKYREMHLGHLHHRKDIKFISTQEFNGMTIRHLRSLSGTDAWHNLKGYKGSVQSAEAFLWSKDGGMVGQFTHSL
tara:strand:- start:5890 stop:7119 length:1230 start_codon:yes stop_codon:yes gene_type:complete